MSNSSNTSFYDVKRALILSITADFDGEEAVVGPRCHHYGHHCFSDFHYGEQLSPRSGAVGDDEVLLQNL